MYVLFSTPVIKVQLTRPAQATQMKSINTCLEKTYHILTKTCPSNIQRFFSAKTNSIISFEKKEDIFRNIFAQSIGCGYTLEPVLNPIFII